ncbi:hypothetical protein C2E23DRAFT_507816 [Lenzites betulinus]|nr:hypothetical protein C2E23DRAFT_507816 [Lenzites betulinus]
MGEAVEAVNLSMTESACRRHCIPLDTCTRSRVLQPDNVLKASSDLQQGVDACLVLLFFCLWRPRAICSWMRADVLSRRSIASLVLDAAKEALLYSTWDTKYCGAVVAKFLTAPWNCPEDRARLAHLKHARRRGGMVHPGPTPDGMVRVKWYPDVEAPLCYPPGLGELWMDVPLESDGRLDLRRLKRAWGMENCFAMYTGPGRRIRVGPQPDEQLSAIAWTVALGSNAVLGVIGRMPIAIDAGSASGPRNPQGCAPRDAHRRSSHALPCVLDRCNARGAPYARCAAYATAPRAIRGFSPSLRSWCPPRCSLPRRAPCMEGLRTAALVAREGVAQQDPCAREYLDSPS